MSADLDAAASAIGWGIFYNSGQTCNAGSRLIVHRSVQDELVERIAAMGAKLAPGEPLDPKTKLGSMVDGRQMDKVLGYVDLGREEGARVVAGGERTREDSGGYYIPPTILDGVANTMRVAREEIFGPVLTVTPFDDEAEALRDRQRHAVRAGRRDLDPRRQSRAPARAADPRRRRLGQHVRHGRHHRAVRWLQAVRVRAGQGPRRARRLHPAQDDLVRPLGW